jgi:hypothetical protein
MAHPGELRGFQRSLTCSCCRTEIPLRVCESNAGFYLGYFCDNCGPYSRETGYYNTEAEAQTDLDQFLDTGTIPATVR